ncbi:hypothetical protein QF015_003563 [Paenarthrobacter sp. TE4293]
MSRQPSVFGCKVWGINPAASIPSDQLTVGCETIAT